MAGVNIATPTSGERVSDHIGTRQRVLREAQQHGRVVARATRKDAQRYVTACHGLQTQVHCAVTATCHHGVGGRLGDGRAQPCESVCGVRSDDLHDLMAALLEPRDRYRSGRRGSALTGSRVEQQHNALRCGHGAGL